MGRRSRKRSGVAGAVRRAPAAADQPSPQPRTSGTKSRRAHLDEAPQPPWAPFPLTEICIFVGLVVLAVALLGGGGSRGPLLVFGLSVVTLATLELALREHFAGYRSHSALLAGITAMLVAAPLALFARPPRGAVLIVGAVIFLLGLQLFREVFRRRAGGMSWRA